MRAKRETLEPTGLYGRPTCTLHPRRSTFPCFLRKGWSVAKRTRKKRNGQKGFLHAANDSVFSALKPGDLDRMQADVERHCRHLLLALRIDIHGDHNTRDTPKRLAKMFVRETFAGRFEPPPCITDFPNAKRLDEIIVVGPVDVRSTCAHHLCPIEGQAWIGIIPTTRIIGLSKFARVTNWIMARPQIQEEATVQLADLLEEALKPKALGVIVSAKHSCMTWRGVKAPDSRATTSVMRGAFRDKPAARAEFLTLIGQFQCR